MAGNTDNTDNRVRPQITLLSFVVTISVLHEAQYSGSTILVHYEREGGKKGRGRGKTRGLCVNEGMRTLADAAGQSTVTFSDIIHTHVYRAEVKGL